MNELEVWCCHAAGERKTCNLANSGEIRCTTWRLIKIGGSKSEGEGWWHSWPCKPLIWMQHENTKYIRTGTPLYRVCTWMTMEKWQKQVRTPNAMETELERDEISFMKWIDPGCVWCARGNSRGTLKHEKYSSGRSYLVDNNFSFILRRLKEISKEMSKNVYITAYLSSFSVVSKNIVVALGCKGEWTLLLLCRVVCTPFTCLVLDVHTFFCCTKSVFFFQFTVVGCFLPSWCCMFPSFVVLHVQFCIAQDVKQRCVPVLPWSFPLWRSSLPPSHPSYLNLPHTLPFSFILYKIPYWVIPPAHRLMFSPHQDASMLSHQGRSQHSSAPRVLRPKLR